MSSSGARQCLVTLHVMNFRRHCIDPKYALLPMFIHGKLDFAKYPPARSRGACANYVKFETLSLFKIKLKTEKLLFPFH